MADGRLVQACKSIVQNNALIAATMSKSAKFARSIVDLAHAHMHVALMTVAITSQACECSV